MLNETDISIIEENNYGEKIILKNLNLDSDNIGSDTDYKVYENSEIMDISLEERINGFSPYLFLKDACDEISNLNILDFNYDQFKEDINDFNLEEFNDFFNVKILDILQKIEDDYLYLKYDQIDLLNHKPLIKSIVNYKLDMVEIIIEFLMFKLPYVYLKKLINQESINTDNYYDILEDINLKEKLIKIMEQENNSLKNLGTLLNTIKLNNIKDENEIKKRYNKKDNLNQNLDKRANINYYYVQLIESTPLDNLKRLFTIYLENDLENII